MSTTLEEIVRPFGIRRINSGKKVVTSTETNGDDATITFGDVGTLPNSFSTLIGTELCKEVWEEQSREEEEKRVENADDSSQFAKVKRVTSMKMKKSDDQTVIKDSFTSWVSETFDDLGLGSFDPPGGSKTGGCNANWNFKNPK